MRKLRFYFLAIGMVPLATFAHVVSATEGVVTTFLAIQIAGAIMYIVSLIMGDEK